MSVSALPARPVERSAESFAERTRRLRAEAEANAREHSMLFARGLAELEAMAADIVDGGEAYSPGVRETARILAGDMMNARLNIEALLGR